MTGIRRAAYIRYVAAVACILSACTLSLICRAEFGPGLDMDDIPPEFRDLAGPQTTVADMFYGGRYLASVTVVYTPDTVMIADPASLVGKIGTVINTDRVTAALSGELSSHPEQVCVASSSRNCGVIAPAVAGIIFDATRFRGDIFIAEPYLRTRTLYKDKFLPESNSSLGLVQGVSATISGALDKDKKQQNYTLFGSTMAGWRENHLVANWDISKADHFSVDTLYLERDARGLQMGAGYLEFSNVMTMEFAASQPILGVKLGSSMRSRLDSADINSTPLRIFTNGPRRVEVLRNKRLIYAESVGAGSQELNTRSFPHGSYDLTIRIYNGSVLERQLTRFFTKSARLPPTDEVLWYMESGEMLRRRAEDALPDRVGEWLTRGGAGFRVLDNASLELRGAVTRKEQAAEAEFFYQGQGWNISTTLMTGSNRAKGAALEAAFTLGPVALSYFHRRLWHLCDRLPGARRDGRLLSSGFENRSLSASTRFLGGSLTGSYSYNRKAGAEANEAIHSLGWYKNLARIADHDLDLELNYSGSQRNRVAIARLTLRRSRQGWNYSVRSVNRHQQKKGEAASRKIGVALDSNWNDISLLAGSAEVGLRYEDLTGTNTALAGRLRYQQPRFRTELSAGYVDRIKGGRSTNYTGRLDTSFAINSESAGLGGGRSADSAVIIDLQGGPGSRFDVLVNGTASGIATGNSTTVVPLSPYATYSISIKPRGRGFYDYDQSVRQVTLYPGNVEAIRFAAAQELVVIGKLVDGDGQAIRQGEITSARGLAQTDDYGLFQARISTGVTELRVKREKQPGCLAVIPKGYISRGGIGVLGVLVCQ